jgi:hypothetical protein
MHENLLSRTARQGTGAANCAGPGKSVIASLTERMCGSALQKHKFVIKRDLDSNAPTRPDGRTFRDDGHCIGSTIKNFRRFPRPSCARLRTSVARRGPRTSSSPGFTARHLSRAVRAVCACVVDARTGTLRKTPPFKRRYASVGNSSFLSTFPS